MEQVLDYRHKINNIDTYALKFTNKNIDGYHDFSFMSPELYHLLTTGDIISNCNLSVIKQLDLLIHQYPSQQKKLENLNILLKTAFSMLIKESSVDLNNFILEPDYYLDLYALYDKIIGSEIDSFDLNCTFSDQITKFIKKMIAFKNPSLIINEKHKFSIDDMKEFNNLFMVLEQKYFRGVINYQVPVFDLKNIEIFYDYQTINNLDLTSKIDESRILKRIHNNKIITVLMNKYTEHTFFSGTHILSILDFSEHSNYFNLLDIVHTGQFEERNEIINDIIEYEKNKYNYQKNYKIWREIVLKVYINNDKRYCYDDIIKFFFNKYNLNYNPNIIIQKTHKKIKSEIAEQPFEYVVLCDKIKLEFIKPFERIYKIYSYSNIEDFYKNESSIRIYLKNFKIFGYPSAMNILAKKNLFKGEEKNKEIDKLIHNSSPNKNILSENSSEYIHQEINSNENCIIFIYLSVILHFLYCILLLLLS